jgi:hypothetical protein
MLFELKHQYVEYKTIEYHLSELLIKIVFQQWYSTPRKMAYRLFSAASSSPLIEIGKLVIAIASIINDLI